MRVLLDTCVISELWRKDGSEKVRKHVSLLRPHNTYLSVLTVGEIFKGIHLLNESKKKRDLQNKLSLLENDYQGNILNIGIETIKIWGEILAVSQRKGKPTPDRKSVVKGKRVDLGGRGIIKKKKKQQMHHNSLDIRLH